MTRSKLSTKVLLLATGIGLSTAAFAGSQPAAAQNTFPAYNVALGACPAGTVYDAAYGCTTAGANDFGYYGYPTVLRGHRDHGFGHMGIGAGGSVVHHGMGFRSIGAVGVDRGFSAAHYGGGGFGHAGGLGGGHR